MQRIVPGRLVRPGAGAIPARALAVAAFAALALPGVARGDDRTPAPWMTQASTAPLRSAPAPERPATVCVIDTGVNATRDLSISARSSLLGGTSDDVRATPTGAGHGTTVSHFAAGKVNGWGGAGAFPHARIASVRVFESEGGANWQDYIRAIDKCQQLDPNVRVVNISLGGAEMAPHEATELENRIELARERYAWNVVVAAGNGGGETDFPGRFPASFTVTGLSSSGGLCSFSARGENIDLAAPGCDLLQGVWTGELRRMNGTSYAAPIVSGVLAAIRSYRPELTPEQAEQILLDSARQGGSFPALDASAALRAAGLGDVVDRYENSQKPASDGGGSGGGGGSSSSGGASEPPPAPAVPAAPLPAPAAAPVEDAPSQTSRSLRRAAAVTRLRAPKSSARRLARGRVLVRVANRPKGAIVEVRIGRRTVRRAIAPSAVRDRPGRVEVGDRAPARALDAQDQAAHCRP